MLPSALEQGGSGCSEGAGSGGAHSRRGAGHVGREMCAGGRTSGPAPELLDNEGEGNGSIRRASGGCIHHGEPASGLFILSWYIKIPFP